MRFSILLLFVLGAQASWFGSDTPAYQSWDTKQLTAWLKDHNIPVPTASATTQKDLQELVRSNWGSAQAFTADQYASAQKAFTNIKDGAFDTWDESTLRQFLLEQGIVNPSGPREQLALMAKQRYQQYQSAASSLSSQASTAVYGSPQYQATQSLSSFVAQATGAVGRQLDDSKDYVYSSWDDNRLRTYLEEKGVLKTKQEATRDEMLKMMRDAYAKVTDPVWDAWTDSYMHEWLKEHGLVKTNVPPPRPTLVEQLKQYYYDTTQYVWHSWTDSELKDWLVQHDVIKSDAQIKREKLQKLVGDNYAHAEDVAWAGWRDSDIRAWLVSNGYLNDDKAAHMSREHLVKLINQKYKDSTAKANAYLVWPDARLRAYLRENGVSEDALPTSRPGLLQETRIRYVQATTKTDEFIQYIYDSLNSGMNIAEEKLSSIVDILSGTSHDAKNKAYDAADSAASTGAKGTASVKSKAAEASIKSKYDL